MSAQNPHTRIITAAAREILRPLGIRQKGRSRLWFDDQGWWAGMIEFQPSSWLRGSYLNVAVQWLWDTQPGSDLTFGVYHYPGGGSQDIRLDFGEGGLIEYESDVQFAPLATKMVGAAAERALYYRDLFRSVEAAAAVLAECEGVSSDIHAGTALGLVGDRAAARRRFQHYLDYDESEDGQMWRGEWMDARADRVRRLLERVDDTHQFRDLVLADVRRVRESLRLDPAVQIPFTRSSPD